jgi:hypothetical protein
MKRHQIDSFVRNFDHIFARLSTYIGCGIALLTVFIFVVNKDPEGINLVPVAKLFFEAAKISVEWQKDTKKLDKPPNQK